MSHRCELELKSTVERQCELCKDVNDFLESLFTFHRASNVVTNTLRQSVEELSISGASAVIRVNGTRWISHTLNAMRNVLNSYHAHIHCYEKLLILDKYAESQKAKVRYYLKKLRDKKILSFMVFMTDVLDTVSVFSKVSQTRQLNVSQMEDTLQLVLSNLELFIKNQDCGKAWNSREKFVIEPADDISKECRIIFTSAIRENFELRCGSDFPPSFYDAMELIDPIKWKHDDMFTFDSKSRAIFAKYKSTDYLDRTVETLTNDKFIRKQLEHQQINVNTIASEWASLKSIIGRWGKGVSTERLVFHWETSCGS